MKFPAFASKIIALQEDDLNLRDQLIREGRLGDGYDPKMERLHIRNSDLLQTIIDEIGYPTISKVGKDAHEAAWLLIQHAISKPQFMRDCLELLKLAVQNEDADPKQLAYLSDRIAVFEGRLQLYGTSFDWDENGQMNPNPYDDLKSVDQRRSQLGLNSMAEQTEKMRKQAKSEQEGPPDNMEDRKAAYNAWRIKVGWID